MYRFDAEKPYGAIYDIICGGAIVFRDNDGNKLVELYYESEHYQIGRFMASGNRNGIAESWITYHISEKSPGQIAKKFRKVCRKAARELRKREALYKEMHTQFFSPMTADYYSFDDFYKKLDQLHTMSQLAAKSFENNIPSRCIVGEMSHHWADNVFATDRYGRSFSHKWFKFYVISGICVGLSYDNGESSFCLINRKGVIELMEQLTFRVSLTPEANKRYGYY